MLARALPSEPCPWLAFILFLRQSPTNFARAGLELTVFLSLPPEWLGLQICTTIPNTILVFEHELMGELQLT
jgi:hypothetical protein